MSVDEVNFGPKCFKIFNHWMDIEGFDSVIESSWNNGVYRGSKDIVLKNKLKQLRTDIKKWSRDHVDLVKRKKNDILKWLVEWDIKAEEGCLTSIDRLKREEYLMDLNFIEQKEIDSLRQKSKVKWAVEGDENSKFFHSRVNKNTKRQNINGLVYNGSWVEAPKTIFLATYNYFASRFHEVKRNRPKFRSSLFRQLDDDGVSLLESNFTMEEIKAAVWDCCSSKSPGPDRFNFKFIKRYRDIVKFDFFNFLKQFEEHGSIAKGCNASFITLIPKKSDPLELSDYR